MAEKKGREMSDEKVYIIPCSGIGKPTASAGREAAYRVVEEKRPGVSDTICLALLTLSDEEALEKIQKSDVITLDGCAKDCARKNVEAAGRPPVLSHRIPDYLKEHRDCKPESVLDIGEGGEKLVEIIAGEVAEEIDGLLRGDS